MTGGLLAQPATRAAMQAQALAQQRDWRKKGVFIGGLLAVACRHTVPELYPRLV
jgi:hypothetical protein